MIATRGRAAVLFIVVLMSVACGDGSPPPEPTLAPPSEPGPAILAGHVVFGHEVRSFRPCDEAEALWLTDDSGLMAALHDELAPHREPYEEVFALVTGSVGPPRTDGFAADYPGEITVRDVSYVASEGFGCGTEWDAFRLRASGNEPFWSVEVSSRGVRLSRPGESAADWTGVERPATEPGERFTGAIGPDIDVELTIEPGPCRDSMSGAFYGLSATMRMGSESWSGCAVRGRLAE